MVPSWEPAWTHMVPAGTQLGASWFPAGTSWCQLVPAAGYQLVPSWYQLVPAGTSWYPAGASWYQLGTSWVPYLDGARAKKITGQKNNIFPCRFRRWPGAGAQKRAGPATFHGFGQGRPQLLLKASLYLDRIWIMLGSFWGHAGVSLESFWNHGWINLG